MSFLPTRGWFPEEKYNLLEGQIVAWLRRTKQHPSIEVICVAIIRSCTRAYEELKADRANQPRPDVSIEDTINQILKPLSGESDANEYESSEAKALKEIAALCVDDSVECKFCDNDELKIGEHQKSCPIAIARRGLTT